MANAFRVVKNCIVNEYSETHQGVGSAHRDDHHGRDGLMLLSARASS